MRNKAARPLDNMLLTYSMSVLRSAITLTQIMHGQQSLGLCTGLPLWRFDTIACESSTGATPAMRSAQIELHHIGMIGRVFETPLDDKALRHKCPRKVNVAVQAWRDGNRATNPHSDKYRDGMGAMFTQINGPCLSLINQ